MRGRCSAFGKFIAFFFCEDLIFDPALITTEAYREDNIGKHDLPFLVSLHWFDL